MQGYQTVSLNKCKEQKDKWGDLLEVTSNSKTSKMMIIGGHHKPKQDRERNHMRESECVEDNRRSQAGPIQQTIKEKATVVVMEEAEKATEEAEKQQVQMATTEEMEEANRCSSSKGRKGRGGWEKRGCGRF